MTFRNSHAVYSVLRLIRPRVSALAEFYQLEIATSINPATPRVVSANEA